MTKDNSLIELNKKTAKIFEDIKDICESYLGDSILTDTDPDVFYSLVELKIKSQNMTKSKNKS